MARKRHDLSFARDHFRFLGFGRERSVRDMTHHPTTQSGVKKIPYRSCGRMEHIRWRKKKGPNSDDERSKLKKRPKTSASSDNLNLGVWAYIGWMDGRRTTLNKTSKSTTYHSISYSYLYNRVRRNGNRNEITCAHASKPRYQETDKHGREKRQPGKSTQRNALFVYLFSIRIGCVQARVPRVGRRRPWH